MTEITDTPAFSLLADEAGFDPIEDRVRANVRVTIEALFEGELAAVLGRLRYGRCDSLAKGYRHGHRERQLTGTFGTETVRVPRARVEDEDGKVTEWRSKALPRYQRLTKSEEDRKTAWGAVFPTNGALVAAIHLAGTNTRRVKRTLSGLFQGAVGHSPMSLEPLALHWLIVVSRAWRKVKVDWDAWAARCLAGEDIVRLILDGTVIRTRLDRKAPNIAGRWPPSGCAATARRSCSRAGTWAARARPRGAVRAAFAAASAATVRPHLDDPDARGLKRPEFVIVPSRQHALHAPAGQWTARPGPGSCADRALGRGVADPALHGSQ